jgi:hypothetical protein
LATNDPELLLGLIKEKNSLGLKFSKTKVRNLARTHFTRKEHFKALEEAGKVRDLYEVLVVHPNQETEISLSMVKAFFNPVVHHAESADLAMEFASDVEQRFGIDGKAIVEEYQKQVEQNEAAEAATAEEDEGEDSSSSSAGSDQDLGDGSNDDQEGK